MSASLPRTGQRSRCTAARSVVHRRLIKRRAHASPERCCWHRVARLVGVLLGHVALEVDVRRDALRDAHRAGAGAVEHDAGVLQRRLLGLHAVDEPGAQGVGVPFARAFVCQSTQQVLPTAVYRVSEKSHMSRADGPPELQFGQIVPAAALRDEKGVRFTREQ